MVTLSFVVIVSPRSAPTCASRRSRSATGAVPRWAEPTIRDCGRELPRRRDRSPAAARDDRAECHQSRVRARSTSVVVHPVDSAVVWSGLRSAVAGGYVRSCGLTVRRAGGCKRAPTNGSVVGADPAVTMPVPFPPGTNGAPGAPAADRRGRSFDAWPRPPPSQSSIGLKALQVPAFLDPGPLCRNCLAATGGCQPLTGLARQDRRVADRSCIRTSRK